MTPTPVVPRPLAKFIPPHLLGNIRLKLKGEYRCVLNEGTDREVDTGWFDNLLTDGGLDRLGGNYLPCTQYGSIGTGTTAPANGNTSLQAFVAQVIGPTFDTSVNIGTPTYAAYTQFHYVYAQGAVVGNMAEVGVGWATGGNNLFSRALILDGGGAPTTLTCTSLDQLTVYYKLTITPTLTDATGTVTLNSIPYNYTARIANCASWCNNINGMIAAQIAGIGRGSSGSGICMTSWSTQTLGAITSTPAGTALNGCASNTVVIGSYTPGQKYLDSTYTAIPSECNSSGGVGSILFQWAQGNMVYQYAFAAVTGGAPIPKDNTKTLAFTIRMSWDRV